MNTAGVIGARTGTSYLIICPQHSGHVDSVYRSTSDGRTSIAFLHCTQRSVRFRITVSLAVLIGDVPLLNCQTEFNYGTQLATRLDGGRRVYLRYILAELHSSRFDGNLRFVAWSLRIGSAVALSTAESFRFDHSNVPTDSGQANVWGWGALARVDTNSVGVN